MSGFPISDEALSGVPVTKVERFLEPLAVERSLHPDRTAALLIRPHAVRARFQVSAPEAEHGAMLSQTGTYLERGFFALYKSSIISL